MRPRTAISALSALLAAGALGAAATGCGSGGASATLDPIAQAAEVTTHSGGAQIALSATMRFPGLASPITMQGGGHFNDARREGSLAIEAKGFPAGQLPGLSGDELTMRELMKGYVVYLSSPLFDGKLPNGASWVKLDLGKAFSSLGIDPQSLTGGGTDPSQILSYLKGSTGTPKVAGHEAVRGVQTTRYEGTISLESVIDRLPADQQQKAREAIRKLSAEIGSTSFPVTVWIDAHHLVRRLSMDYDLSVDGKSASIDIGYEEFDFGPTPAVVPPPSSETYDATALTSSALSSAGG